MILYVMGLNVEQELSAPKHTVLVVPCTGGVFAKHTSLAIAYPFALSVN